VADERDGGRVARTRPVDPRPIARTTATPRPLASAELTAPAAMGTWQRALFLPLTILAWLAVLLVAVWLLGHVTRTLLLIVLSTVLAFAFTPLANLLARRMPRPLALGLAYLLGVGLVLGFGALVVLTTANEVQNLVSSLPGFQEQAQAMLPRAEAILVRFGVPAGSLGDFEQRLVTELQAAGTLVAGQALTGLAEFFGTVIDLVLVMILSVYLSANGPGIARWLQEETPPSQRARARLLVTIVNRVVGGYVRGTLALALVVGVLVGGGMAVLGVPYAVLLGVLAFFMAFIPVLGVLISGAAAVLIALFYFHEPWRPLIVLGYFGAIHVLSDDVIGPRVMGKAVGIHPATALVALMVGTELFGVWGALFAAPLAGLMQASVTAAWLELRGGDPQQVLQAVADAEGEKLEDKIEIH
jgi:predicted PurR-regulated permease PerM